VQGAAIYYDSFYPTLSNNSFTSNSAPYGPAVASYPIKIVKDGSQSIALDNIGSGTLIESPLQLTLMDYQNQVWISNQTAQIKITSADSSSKVSGIDYAVVTEGHATFDSLVFTAEPGKEDVKYSLSSKAIDSNKLSKVFGNQIGSNEVSVNFRYCKPGEILNGDSQCTE
jgi:hypothetical protein